LVEKENEREGRDFDKNPCLIQKFGRERRENEWAKVSPLHYLPPISSSSFKPNSQYSVSSIGSWVTSNTG